MKLYGFERDSLWVRLRCAVKRHQPSFALFEVVDSGTILLRPCTRCSVYVQTHV